MSDPVPRMNEFQLLLRHILLQEKRSSIARISAALGMQQRTFYARLENGSRFSPGDITILLREIPDERLAQWLIGDRMVLVERPSAINLTSNGIRRHALLGSLTAAEALAQLLQEAGPFYPADTLDLVEKEVGKCQGHFLWMESCVLGQRPGEERPWPEQFLQLVNRFIIMHNDLSVEELGGLLCLTYDQIQGRLSGRVRFDEQDVRKLLCVFPEPRIANYFLGQTPYIATRRTAIIATDLLASPLQAIIRALRSVQKLLLMLPSSFDLRQALVADLHVWQEVLSQILGSLDECKGGIIELRRTGTVASRKNRGGSSGQDKRNDQVHSFRRPNERPGPRTQLSLKFSDFLYKILNPGRQRSFSEIAAGLGISPRRMRELLMNDTKISAEEIFRLLNYTANVETAKWFFSESALTVLDYPENGFKIIGRDPLDKLTAAIIGCGDILLAVSEALGSPEGDAAIFRKIRELTPPAIAGLLSAKSQVELFSSGNLHKNFASTFERVLFLEKRLPPASVAAAIGLTERELRHRLDSAKFTPAEYRTLFRVYPEPTLADAILAGTPYLVFLPGQEERTDNLLSYILSSLRICVETLVSNSFLEEVHQNPLGDLVRHIREGIRQLALGEWHAGHSHIQRKNARYEQRHRGRVFGRISPVQEATLTIIRSGFDKQA